MCVMQEYEELFETVVEKFLATEDVRAECCVSQPLNLLCAINLLRSLSHSVSLCRWLPHWYSRACRADADAAMGSTCFISCVNKPHNQRLQLSADAFFAHCSKLLKSPRHEDAAANLHILLSALDFRAFCDLMAREAIATQQALKAAEDMGL